MKLFRLTKNSIFFTIIFCLLASQVFAQDKLDSQKPSGVSHASWASLKDAVLEAKILPEDVMGVGGQQANFGQNVSIDGTRAAIGAPGMLDYGVVYIFEFDNVNWNRTAIIEANDAKKGTAIVGGDFGYAVSLDGDRLAVGDIKDANRTGAVYIFELQTGAWEQTDKLIANDASVFSGFGNTVSLENDRILIGAYTTRLNGNSNVGAAYIFDLVAGVWTQSAKLFDSAGVTSDYFGWSASLSNNTVLIGVTGDDDIASDSGAVYVYDLSGGIWTETIKLTAPDSIINSRFGTSLKLDGNSAIIASRQSSDLPGEFSVSSYIYELSAGVWSLSEKLLKSSTNTSSGGYAVDLEGNKAIVSSGDGLYVFDKIAGFWSETNFLVSADNESGDSFGVSIGLSNNTIIVGAFRDDDYGYNSGSVYVFTESMGAFSQSAKLKGDTGGQHNSFGNSVSVSGNRAIVGVQTDGANGWNYGAAYIFDLKAGVWVQTARLTASDGVALHFYGGAVDIDGDRAIVGAANDDQVASDAGAVYIYDRVSDGVWNESKIVTTDGTNSDRFGFSLSLDGDKLIAGAYNDDENGIRAGSAYIFERLNGVWTQVEKLLPSDVVSNDNFGSAVRIEDDVAIVGANRQQVNGFTNGGSVYVFGYSSNSWAQTQKLNAAITFNTLLFGQDIDIEGNRMLIGSNSGAYVFEMNMGVWSQTQILPRIAHRVSLEGNLALLGYSSGFDGPNRTGYANVFELTQGTWYHTALIKGDGVINGQFAGSVSLNGDSAFVGHPYDDELGFRSGSVNVFDIDVMPDAVANSEIISEDANATIIDVLTNDTDVDAGPKFIQSVIQPTNGTVVNNTSNLSYTPNLNYCNSGGVLDTFSYTLNGGSTAIVTMRVNCVDDFPVAESNAFTLTEDAIATTIDVLTNDTDVDAGPKTIDSVTQPTNGIVVNNVSDLTYMPNENYCNNGTVTDNFMYSLNGGSQATVSIEVTCVDDFPVAVANTSIILEDVATTIDVLTNDTDVDAGPREIDSVTQPTNGTVVNNVSDLTYTPDENYCNDGVATDDFMYSLNGGSQARVSVEVTCEDDFPVAVANSFAVIEDDTATTIDVLSDDTDVDAGPIQIDSITQPANGTVVNNVSDLTYTPNENYCNDHIATDDFSYTLNGGSQATVSVEVDCINDAPSFNNVCDVDVSDYIDMSNQLFQMQLQNILMGPNEDSIQQVSMFNVSIDDPDGIFNEFTIDTSGLIMMDLSLNIGIATIGVSLTDNGGTALGGQNTSIEQFFDIVYLDSGLIPSLLYRNSFDRDCNFIP
jgi:hypothetical protein